MPKHCCGERDSLLGRGLDLESTAEFFEAVAHIGEAVMVWGDVRWIWDAVEGIPTDSRARSRRDPSPYRCQRGKGKAARQSD